MPKDEMSKLLAGIRASVDALEAELHREPTGPKGDLSGRARRLSRQANVRDRFFPGLSRDPAWSLMLELYIARADGRKISTSAACRAARVPDTTGLRYMDGLEREGLLLRAADASDRRMVIVELTQEAAGRMTLLLAELDG